MYSKKTPRVFKAPPPSQNYHSKAKRFSTQLIVMLSIYSLVIPPQYSLASGASGNSIGTKLQAMMNSLISAVQPVPSDPNTLESQLKRYKGQTSFLNATPYVGSRGGGGPWLEAAPQAGDKAVTESREIQESDIFQMGKAGSQNLFLLNSYRGLQVVNFTDGADKAKILGRAAPTGNYPDQMYYDKTQDRIIVLERNNNDSNYDEGVKSRLVVYNVKNPEKPEIINTLDLEGDIADSRLVGNVLYLGTSVMNYYYDYSGNQSKKNKGFVYSVLLDEKEVKIIEQKELSLPVSGKENMNVVQVGNQYYLIAVLSENHWGLQGRSSLVEVVDISDPNGKIQHLMTASTRGSVDERSQTTIKDGALIVTSNYFINPESTTDRKLRLAIESFTLPIYENGKLKAGTPVLSEKEYQYRKLHIDLELEKVLDPDAKEDASKKLYADAILGLKGVYIESASGYKKIIPESVVTLGDTTGLHAELQDVRYVGNHAYVFWVPQTRIDPFEVFDISNVNQIKHLDQLKFDGWIERTFPVSYNGKNLILGLGWEVPAIDNESGRAIPKAMIFDVVVNATSGKVEQKELANLQLDMKRFYTDFNAPDKYIEYKLGADGKGSIMFSGYGSGYDATGKYDWYSGAKLVGFDLEAAISGTGAALQEGAFIRGQSSWLKRVFSNPAIDKINIFTDVNLATYDVEGAIGNADATAKSIQVLELARNIQGYEVLGKTDKKGIQIISTGQYYYFEGDSKKEETNFRIVSSDQGDAENNKTLSQLTIDGSYKAHVKLSDGETLLVVTEDNEKTKTDPVTKVTSYERNQYVSLLKLIGNQLTVVKTVLWVDKDASDSSTSANFWNLRFKSLNKLSENDEKQFLISSYEDVKLVTLSASNVELKKLTLKDCVFEGKDMLGFSIYGGNQLAFLSREYVSASQDPGATEFYKNFIARAQIAGDVVQCESPVNIPGTPLTFTKEGYLLTEDEQYIGQINYGKKEEEPKPDTSPATPPGGSVEPENSPARMSPPPYYDEEDNTVARSVKNIVSLKLEPQKATLQSNYDLEDKKLGGTFHLISGNKVAFVSIKEKDSYYPWYGYRGGHGGYQEEQEATLSILSLDAVGDILENKIPIADVPGNSQFGILGIFEDSKNMNQRIGVISVSGNISVFGFEDTSSSFTPKELIDVKTDFTLSVEPQKTVKIQNYWGYGGGNQSAPVYESDKNRISIPQGYYGIKQFFIKE